MVLFIYNRKLPVGRQTWMANEGAIKLDVVGCASSWVGGGVMTLTVNQHIHRLYMWHFWQNCSHKRSLNVIALTEMLDTLHNVGHYPSAQAKSKSQSLVQKFQSRFWLIPCCQSPFNFEWLCDLKLECQYKVVWFQTLALMFCFL